MQIKICLIKSVKTSICFHIFVNECEAILCLFFKKLLQKMGLCYLRLLKHGAVDKLYV